MPIPIDKAPDRIPPEGGSEVRKNEGVLGGVTASDSRPLGAPLSTGQPDPTSNGQGNSDLSRNLPGSFRSAEVRDEYEQGTKKVNLGRRDLLPYHLRTFFHQIVDLPHALIVFFGPVPRYSLETVKDRVCEMWQTTPNQLQDMVNKELLGTLIAIHDRRSRNNKAFISDLLRTYASKLKDSESIQMLRAEVTIHKNKVFLTCFITDPPGIHKGDGRPRSEKETKSFFATVFAFAEYLRSSGSDYATLSVHCGGGGAAELFEPIGYWFNQRISYQAGLRDERMKIVLKDPRQS